MAQYWKKHFGVELTEDEVMGFVSYAANNGNLIWGYHNLPYINMHMGDFQLICKAQESLQSNKKKYEIYSVDTHSIGRCVWNVEILGPIIGRDDEDLLEKRILVSPTDKNNGLAVINVVNADVLPTYRKGERIKLQMIAYVNDIDFYEDEDSYADCAEETEDGKKLLLGDSCIFPSGFLSSSKVSDPRNIIDISFVRGVVKNMYIGKIKVNEMEQKSYVRTVIETEFGDLELIHSPLDIKEEQRKRAKPGSFVVANVALSGDPAIYEYTKGIVLDEKNNLKVLSDVLLDGNPERLRQVLSKNARYYSETSKNEILGADEIIDWIKSVQKEGSEKRFIEYAEIDNNDLCKSERTYPKGKACLALSYNSYDHFDNLVFIELNDENKIELIYISKDSSYVFSIKPDLSC